MTRVEILGALRRTPARIAELTRGLSADQLTRRPEAGEWSVAETLSHLLLGERDLILPRFERMLREDHAVFPSSTPTRTGFAADPVPGDVPADLAAFRAVRVATLRLLEALGDAEWQRRATTPTRGTLTLEAYARYLAEHDTEHLRQLARTRDAITGAAP